MSIGSALSNAYSGLVASARMAETISSNVANALNENYSQRSVELSAEAIDGRGAGVRVQGIVRLENVVATAARRSSGAETANSETLAAALQRLESVLGLPGEADALPSRVAKLELALVAAAATPESGPGLSNVVSAASELAAAITTASSAQQAVRVDAETEINRQVQFLNSALEGVERLNQDIQSLSAAGADASGLLDQRKALVDQISAMIPVRVIARANQSIAVFSAGGLQLVDGPAAQLGFAAAGQITPDMAIGNGSLSALTVNGRPVTIGLGGGVLDGGALSANFTVRDVVVPQADIKLDALAIDLIVRFETPAVDPTMLPGDAGLFTDAGLAANPLATEGIAARISVNTLVDPAQGGEVWRIRSGLYALVSGDAGDGTILANMRDMVAAATSLPAGSGISTMLSLADHAAEMAAQLGTAAFAADEKASFQAARAAGFKESELAAIGVNTDREMQQLLLVEQAYAANARVISVIDNLLKTLMEI